MILPVHLDGLDGATRTAMLRELQRGEVLGQVQAKLEYEGIAREVAATPRRAMDGLGRPVLEVPLTSFLYWDQRERGCWQDKQFIKEYARDNPGARVEAKGTKVGTGWTPEMERGSGVRERIRFE